uniref:Ig-like domain-containing protein n=1 Tax=Neogobius melanostomus TaxID=47308 RepID=A0A8C6S4Y6_9GOBI
MLFHVNIIMQQIYLKCVFLLLSVNHTLGFFTTASPENSGLPQLVSVGVLNDLVIFHYDSETKRMVPKQEWMKRVTEDEPQYWETYTQVYLNNDCLFEFLSSVGGVVNSALLHPSPLTWLSPVAHSSSSPVTCFASGFYPDKAKLFWTKDGEELQEDWGKIRPNHDGTFQSSVSLDLSSVPTGDWDRYSCVFQLSGVKDDLITKLDPGLIRTNGETGPLIVHLEWTAC